MSEQDISIEAAEATYWSLNRIFSSEHNDSQPEQTAAIEEIRRALVNGVTRQKIETKMKQMVQMQSEKNDFKTKLSAAIRNRFWEKQFVQPMIYRKFQP